MSGEPWTERQMLEQASRAVGRILRDDVRAMTLLSIDDITAMTLTLMALGLVPTPPGAPSPAGLILNPERRPSDGQ